MRSPLHSQRGFILPLTMILSLLLLAFVFHALLLLYSDRQFFRQVHTQFQLQQLRECVLNDLEQKIKEKTLPSQGTVVYHKGTVTFSATESGGLLKVKFTLSDNQSKETDQMTYSMESGEPVNWLERIDP
ncbi:competence type IV pilus minor pilin ComGG [Sporolactobacillus laevolacticus]|uniref:competence type IV pilus minor pilin ComGG n=1 Tax=Sporolactobacillus laevolacticus TaxID=33018 RepID=UPI0025B3C3F1|nr:competence type IV pilus minor pilin ComGG [Sporolactobacillus laevolacticus]MDN3956432.1 competence type IV pilus minor pilin ComGG [Sporolactobacillus laevolacticus]